jgi:hypothetical protein
MAHISYSGHALCSTLRAGQSDLFAFQPPLRTIPSPTRPRPDDVKPAPGGIAEPVATLGTKGVGELPMLPKATRGFATVAAVKAAAAGGKRKARKRPAGKQAAVGSSWYAKFGRGSQEPEPMVSIIQDSINQDSFVSPRGVGFPGIK